MRAASARCARCSVSARSAAPSSPMRPSSYHAQQALSHKKLRAVHVSPLAEAQDDLCCCCKRLHAHHTSNAEPTAVAKSTTLQEDRKVLI